MLQAEREQAGVTDKTSTSQAPPETGGQSPHGGSDANTTTVTEQAQVVPEDKKQTPKSEAIEYEDIWDDVPPLTTPQAPTSTIPTIEHATPANITAREDCGRSTGNGGGDETISESLASGVFLPWASGDNTLGMDALPPAAGVIEKRKEELCASVVEQHKNFPGTDKKEVNEPVWYSKYTEKAQAQHEGPNTGESTAAVPPTVHSVDPTESCSEVSIGFSTAPAKVLAEPAKLPAPASQTSKALCNELDEMD